MTMSVDCPECGESAERFFYSAIATDVHCDDRTTGKRVDEIHDDGEWLYYHLKPAEGESP